MRKLSIVLSIALLLLISIFPVHGSDDTEELSISDTFERSLPPTRWTDRNTNLIISPGKGAQIEYSENISSQGEVAFTFDRNSLQSFTSLPATYHTTQDIGNGNVIVDHGPYTFIAHVIRGPGGAWFSFWLSRYDSRIDHWDQSLEIHNVTGYSTVGCELAIAGDQIFYGFYLISSTSANSRIFVKHIDVGSWVSLMDTVPFRLDRTGHISKGGKFLTVENDLLVFWVKEDSKEGFTASYSNLGWGDPIRILFEVTDMVPVVHEKAAGNEVVLIYRKNANEKLNVTVSDNAGISWSAPIQQNISFPGNDIHMTSTQFDGIINVLIVSRNSGVFKVYRSMDGRAFTYTDFEGDLGVTDLLDGKFQGQIISDRSQVVLALESQDRNIKMFHSMDTGLTYEPFTTLGNVAWCPVFDEGKDYIAYSQGSELIVHRFVASASGYMRSEPIHPIGIHSWSDFGFLVDGFGVGSTLEMRIIEEDGTTQLFPETGYIDILSLSEGTIDGTYYSHHGQFTGDWAMAELDGPIILEVFSTRSTEEQPAILEISLNYTNSFPFQYSLSSNMHVVSMANMTMVPTGIQLRDYKAWGSFILGPIEKEEDWCDLIDISLSSYSHKISVTVGIRDGTMGKVPMFSTNDCIVAWNTSTINHIRWGTRYLKDLPETIDMIYLEFLVEAEEPTTRTTVRSFNFEYSTDPRIEDVTLEVSQILRGQGTDLFVLTSDREDPANLLRVKLLLKDPDTGIWSDDLVEGQIWDGNGWTIPIKSSYECNIGIYELNLTLIDSMGDRSFFQNPLNIEIMNNRPVAPGAYIIPDIPTTGDELGVEIYRDGMDLETDPDNLTYNFRFYRDDIPFREVLNSTDDHLVIEEGIIKEGEVWKVEITTWDGDNESFPSVSSITVFNTLPKDLEHPKNITLMEDSVSQGYDYLSWFEDKDGEELEIEFSISHGLDINITNGTVIIIPEADFNGEGWLTVVASDEEGGARVNIKIIVDPVNDLPIIAPLYGASVEQGEWLDYMIISYDPADGDNIEVVHDLKTVIPGVVSGLNYMELPNGTFKLFAINEMVGTHTIIVTAHDGTASVNSSFEITISNINDDPLKPMIQIKDSGAIFSEEETITLVALADDPDLPWGDVLTYQWTSSISGGLGSTETLALTLEPGIHTITLNVFDSSSRSNSTSVIIEVVPLAPETKEVMDTPTFLLLIGVITFVLGVLIALTIFFLTKKKQRSKDEEKKLEEGKEEEKKKDKKEGEQEKKKENEKGGEGKTEEKKEQNKNGEEPTAEGGEKNE